MRRSTIFHTEKSVSRYDFPIDKDWLHLVYIARHGRYRQKATGHRDHTARRDSPRAQRRTEGPPGQDGRRGKRGGGMRLSRLTFQILCKLDNSPDVRQRFIPNTFDSSLTHGGIARRRSAILSRVIGATARFGRSGAYCIIIAAARSSARVSTRLFTISISALRKFAMRFRRERRSSAICPLFSVSRYSTNLRSRSSAVLGAVIEGLLQEFRYVMQVSRVLVY